MQESVNEAKFCNLSVVELSISNHDTVLVDHVHHTGEHDDDDEVEGEEGDHVP